MKSYYITAHIMEVPDGYHLGIPQYEDFFGRKIVKKIKTIYK